MYIAQPQPQQTSPLHRYSPPFRAIEEVVRKAEEDQGREEEQGEERAEALEKWEKMLGDLFTAP